MAFKLTSFSNGMSSGGGTNVSVGSIPFLPAYLRFTISSRTSTNETFVTETVGFTDGNLNKAHSIFHDGTGDRSRYYTDRCLNHLIRSGGNITEIIKATFVSFDNNGGGDFGFTLSFTAADANYPITVEAFA